MNRYSTSVRLRVHRRISTVEVEGTLHAPVPVRVRHRVARLLSRGQRRIVLDLARLTDIDAAGVGELVRIRNMAAAAGATLNVVRSQRWVSGLLEVAGLMPLLAPDTAPFAATDLRLLDETGVYPLDCRPGVARG